MSLWELDVDGTGTLTTSVKVAADAEGTLTNMAEVTSLETELDIDNNSADDVNDILRVADVGIEKDDGVAVALAGETVTYQLTVTNYGPSTATGIMVTDTLPNSLKFISASSPCEELTGEQKVVCPLVGELGVGDNRSVTLTAKVAADATGSITNQVIVSATEEDEFTSNNSAVDINTIEREADLRITKTDGQSAGDQ